MSGGSDGSISTEKLIVPLAIFIRHLSHAKEFNAKVFVKSLDEIPRLKDCEAVWCSHLWVCGFELRGFTFK
jgi:hypothetical protein